MGLRSHCRRARQRWSSAIGPDGEEHPPAARDRASSQTKPGHNVERFPGCSYECAGGMDFFTVEVLRWRGLVTYYVLFFLHLESRRVQIAGITRHPDQEWMEQIARSATQEDWGYLHSCRYVLHDRDKKFCGSFRSELASGGVRTIPLPAKSPNLNAFAERWVRSVKQECLSKAPCRSHGTPDFCMALRRSGPTGG